MSHCARIVDTSNENRILMRGREKKKLYSSKAEHHSVSQFPLKSLVQFPRRVLHVIIIIKYIIYSCRNNAMGEGKVKNGVKE